MTTVDATSVPLLRLEDVHVHYGDAHVLDGVSFEVPAGRCVAVLGRNGVGKTTLARAVIGFTPPSRGRVLLQGGDLARLASRHIVERGLAIVPQGRRVFASLTVEENLRVARRSDGSGTGAAASARVQSWDLDRIYHLFPRLLERRRQAANTLSGGEQQMLAIGRALMTRPNLLILDEPTEGLAPIVIDGLVKTMQTLRQSGVSLLLLEQRVEVALRLADQVVAMTSHGRITFDGPASDYSVHDSVNVVHRSTH